MKKFISSVIIFLVVLLAAVAISKNDAIKYNNTMNRLGMSDDATVLRTNSKKNLTNTVKKLSTMDLSSYQLIFFDKNNSSFGYIYSNHTLHKLPTISGRYFSKTDFQSETPFAVQGQQSDIPSYKPQSQEYIKSDKRYISVIGNIGFNNADILNEQTLVSISPTQPKSNKTLSDVVPVIDGKITSSKHDLSQLKKVMRVSSTHKYSPQTDDFSEVQTNSNGNLYIISLLLTFLVSIAVEIYILLSLRFDIKKTKLTGDLKNNYRNGLLIRYLLFTMIPYAAAFAWSNWKIVIISHSTFNIYLILSVIAAIAVGVYQIYFVKKRSDN
ncbi:hypothetical protein [Companilactobacillus sp.]|jgi:hypothetical protein|uniref:hypothetical protein n=1 Tax=Companilactobacillus sp. TaxID=2767905 RepID=UPI0025C5D6D4|nr:hypothetical protein [Companilactobacillus sp.]MCH4008235.1 hypothetical protein [Companilactobacillus sp.]MCH4051586.1 hypothetical protein [Companilactobacillus sp.]MCH4076178.1 hypothetical protein [Companilactobacillus sp.]MCH4124753.1 hypothetical protein [Companilactobacillus sp.]MCH4131295.1 hypothetical protein [Companilactobacillus sp.]